MVAGFGDGCARMFDLEKLATVGRIELLMEGADVNNDAIMWIDVLPTITSDRNNGSASSMKPQTRNNANLSGHG